MRKSTQKILAVGFTLLLIPIFMTNGVVDGLLATMSFMPLIGLLLKGKLI